MSAEASKYGSVPWGSTAPDGRPVGGPYARRRDERRLRPVVECPDHPGQELSPLPGGAARGICPVDGRSYQMDVPEVT